MDQPSSETNSALRTCTQPRHRRGMWVVDTGFVGDRFLIRVPLPDSTVLRLSADTGGGYVVDPVRVGCLPRVPLPPGTEGVRLPIDSPMPAARDIAQPYPPTGADANGVVNAWWFTGRIWAFDYRLARLRSSTPARAPEPRPASPRERTVASPFPRVQAVIDDEAVDLLPRRRRQR